jgi:hypothetical protein
MFVWYGCDCGRVVVADDDDNSGWMKSDGGRQRIRPFQVRRCACVIARHDEKVGRTRRSCVVLLRKVNLEHWGGDCSHLRVLSNPIGSSRRISLRTSAIEALAHSQQRTSIRYWISPRDVFTLIFVKLNFVRSRCSNNTAKHPRNVQ